MKIKTKTKITSFALLLCITFPQMMVTSGCNGSIAIPTNNNNSLSNILIALAFDRSPSFSDYRQADTAFVSRICHCISKTGGIVIVYGIGNPSDNSGLRCSLKKIPPMDPSLVLSKQLALKQHIDMLKAYNENVIREFLKVVQEQILGPPTKNIKETDINGVLKKLDVLMNEPEYSNFRSTVLVYSDGIQNHNGINSNAHYDFKSRVPFVLCLCGWKTPFPTHSIAIKQFEDTEGFAQYIESSNSL